MFIERSGFKSQRSEFKSPQPWQKLVSTPPAPSSQVSYNVYTEFLNWSQHTSVSVLCRHFWIGAIQNFCKFWPTAFTVEHYKSLATKAIGELVSFHSSYLCEPGFSQICKIKTINKLHVSSCLRIALTKIVAPHFDRLQSNIK